MKCIYIPPAKFSFYLQLQVSSVSEPIIGSLQFHFYPLSLDLPHSLKEFPHIQHQLDNYFLKRSSRLEIPHELNVKTAFQHKVLQALQNISYGNTCSYGELAKQLNSHPRAIGQALKSNPLPLIYPCHRVLSKAGLGGFMGQATGERCDIKQQLLKLEQS